MTATAVTAESTAPASADASDLRAIGDRIEGLLDELHAATGEAAWRRVQELVGLVTDLYGAGLSRVIELTGADVCELAGDELVASLLVLHDLHPLDLQGRVEEALARVRPYLGSHGGDVELLGVDGDEGVVFLRMLGSCDGCPSSSVTLTQAVERAIGEAAPEISRIDVGGAARPTGRAPTPITLSEKPLGANGLNGAGPSHRTM